MKILFIGFIVRPHEVNHYPGASVAGNLMQMSYIKHLHHIMADDIEVIAHTPISIFPKSSLLIKRSSHIDLGDRIIAQSPGFLNLPVIKPMIQKVQTKRYLKQWLAKHALEKRVIIVFNTLPQIASPIITYSGKQDIKTICIFADPPIDFIKRNIVARLYKNIEFHQSAILVKKFDAIVALNANIIKDYTPNLPHLIIEGGVSVTNDDSTEPLHKSEQRIVMYAGALTAYSGCQQLIEAVQLMDRHDFVLEIYGTGPLQGYIESVAKKDKRIVYGSYLKHDEMISREKTADFLINPRLISDPISHYSFPSKILEYLASGTPTLSTHFDGLLDEYKSYLVMMHSDQPKDIAKSLDHVLDSDYSIFKDNAIRAKEFLMKEKSWETQIQKLITLINSLSL